MTFGMAIDQARTINSQLAAHYLSKWTNLCEAGGNVAGASNPLLLGIWPDYCQAEVKILVVGQETCGWHGNFTSEPRKEIIEWLQDGYKAFALGECYRSTPFWRFAHQLNSLLNPGSSHRALAWSNLNLIDVNRARPDGIEHALADVSKLQGEVRILNPDVVVFLTGPNYDWLIERQFEGSIFAEVDGIPLRHVARVVHRNLPQATFRTYHPAFLQRTRTFTSTLDKVIQLCRS